MAESPHRTSPIETVARLLDSGDLTLEQLQKFLDHRREIEKILAEAGQHEIIIENMLRYKTQFEALSEEARNGFTWDQVVNNLFNKPKFRLAPTMQGGGQIWFVTKKGRLWGGGELLFKDAGSEPVIYLKNKKTGEMTVIYDRNEDRMRSAKEQIAQGKAEWANYHEMVEAVQKAGFKLFAANPDKSLSDDMEWAAKANKDGLFVANSDKAQRASSILLNAQHAYLNPTNVSVYVYDSNLDYRDDYRGAMRWL